MIRTLRAAGIAAAVLGFAASALAGPSQAMQGKMAPFSTKADGEVTGDSTQHSFFSAIADRLAGLADASVPRPRSLDELVDAYGRTQVAGEQQDCLANAVYFEARGEPIEGQLAVAEVVLNRAASGRYPTTICEVVVQPWQFSFVRNGVIPEANRSSRAWKKAVAIARIAEARAVRELPNDVLWYHADYVAPSWGKRLDRETKIGLHIFYS